MKEKPRVGGCKYAINVYANTLLAGCVIISAAEEQKNVACLPLVLL